MLSARLQALVLALRRCAGSCARTPPPPCAPCPRAPPPPCRVRAPPVPLARRVTCCPPPPGARPPCAPCPPAAPLSCTQNAQRRPQIRPECQPSPPTTQERNATCEASCGPQDRVARRLSLARLARRRDYERDVCESATRAPAPSPPRYRLAGERECALATDGCTYAVRSERATGAPACCGEDRVPPPPSCVELAPDDACRPYTGATLDPCAHTPRTLLCIDRKPRPPPAPAPAPPPPCVKTHPATRAGDSGWCSAPPPPPGVPLRCRRPSIVERLRARSAPPSQPPSRPLHTSASTGAPPSVERRLKEAGLGRVVVEECRRPRAVPVGGRLDVRVPPGTERVRVLVSLEAADGGASAACCPPRAPPPACGTRPTLYPCDKGPVVSQPRAVTRGTSHPCPAPGEKQKPKCPSGATATTSNVPNQKTTTGKSQSTTSAFVANTVVRP